MAKGKNLFCFVFVPSQLFKRMKQVGLTLDLFPKEVLGFLEANLINIGFLGYGRFWKRSPK